MINFIKGALKRREILGYVSRHIDEHFYLTNYPDAAAYDAGPARHYADLGWRRKYDPAPWFSTEQYIDENPDVSAAQVNPFYHFLKWGKSEGRAARNSRNGKLVDLTGRNESSRASSSPGGRSHKRLTSRDVAAEEFDAEFYLQNNPDLPGDIDPFEHFLIEGWKDGRDPAPWFSIEQYLEENPDVRNAGENPFLHFLAAGWKENRLLRPKTQLSANAAKYCDGASEWRDYEVVRNTINSFGGRQSADTGALDFCVALKGLDLSKEARRISFPDHSKGLIDVSIIIPCLNEIDYTMECLRSIANALSGSDISYEVIVFDNGSSDQSKDLLPLIKNLVYLRSDTNTGFGPANNSAVEAARGRYVFFLNNDAQLAPGALETLISVLNDDPQIGAIGPKLLGFDGLLQESGAYLKTDGSGTLVGFGQDHRSPRFNYQREVEYVSGAALLMRRIEFTALGGFDPLYAPAYCEDADLCYKLREKGLKTVYEPRAIVAHHLSATANSDGMGAAKKRLAVRNQQKFASRWQRELLDEALQTRLIAFYLPQYHPIPENDRWWGKGFTEWRNIGAARPNYAAHRQPRVPTDLGYYDLRLIEAMEEQAKLAKRYGVHGFCYYYYWFDGKRLLEAPLENMLASGKPDMPFCLCWANENWTRTWDGKETDVLMAQDYCEENDLAIIADLARYLKDPRYIRVNGRPLLLVYRVKLLPNFARTARIWRNYCEESGVGEICLASVESFELSATPEDPAKFGCDISVEFPPHGMAQDKPAQIMRSNPDFTGAVHDYRNLAYAYAKREEPGFKRLRSVLVGWDNTPRRQNASLVMEHATPGAFQAWLEWTLLRTREQNFGEERIVFINAWNEWCEGAYLEPDADYGHAYLQAVRNALESAL